MRAKVGDESFSLFFRVNLEIGMKTSTYKDLKNPTEIQIKGPRNKGVSFQAFFSRSLSPKGEKVKSDSAILITGFTSLYF